MMKKKTQSVIDIYLAWPIVIIAILLLGDIVLWLTEPRGALILLPFILIATAFALLLYFTRQSKLQGALQAYAIGACEVHTTIFDEMPTPYCMSMSVAMSCGRTAAFVKSPGIVRMPGISCRCFRISIRRCWRRMTSSWRSTRIIRIENISSI